MRLQRIPALLPTTLACLCLIYFFTGNRNVKECIIELWKKEYTENEKAKFLSRQEVANILNISLVTLTDWMKKGLPYHKPNRRVYFLNEEVTEYIKSQKNKRSSE